MKKRGIYIVQSENEEVRIVNRKKPTSARVVDRSTRTEGLRNVPPKKVQKRTYEVEQYNY